MAKGDRMTNTDNWTPWTPEGCLTDLPANSKADDRIYSAANDNRRPLLLGITGKRNVGKSTVATLLEERFGFARAHAFDGGKEAAMYYFAHVTGSIQLAHDMVYGDLKDKPSPYLPGGVAPR